MKLEKYPLQPGQHPDTAVLRNILAFQGVEAEHMHQPFTEAMLLGIGGGPGMGYILWEFKENDNRILVLGFRNNWQYPVRFMQNLCERLNIAIRVEETGSGKQAAQNLLDVLENGQPAMAWLDLQGLPYFELPENLSGQIRHVVGVFGMEEGGQRFWLDDRASEAFQIDGETLARSRGRISSYKNRLMTFEASGEINLESAIWAGLEDAAVHLSGHSDSFSLPALRKWARMMTNESHKKGWKSIFSDGRYLYGNLKSIFLHTLPTWSDGGTLRGLYADFLDEAAPVINNPALKEIAGRYRSIEKQWRTLGEAALPESVPVFARIKTLEVQKLAVLVEKGERGLEEYRRLKALISELQQGFNEQFPLEKDAVDDLLAGLENQLMEIYQAELTANQALNRVVGR